MIIFNKKGRALRSLVICIQHYKNQDCGTYVLHYMTLTNFAGCSEREMKEEEINSGSRFRRIASVTHQTT